jgi:uncharacterized protein (DUF169 family)
LRRIQEELREAWTGITFYMEDEGIPDVREPADLRFCEAVVRARAGPLLMRPGSLSCPGANYVFGWRGDLGGRIEANLSQRWGIGPAVASKMMSQVPVLPRPPKAIGLNTSEVPDVIVSYCQPTTAMELLRYWQAEFDGMNLGISLSSVFSVCGNVSVGSFRSKDMSLSFGCMDSRQFGGIGRDRLVIGIPYELLDRLTILRAEPEQAAVA